MTQYCLNENLLFDDETFQITHLSNFDDSVKLSATAARCLKILIEHKGKTVTKDILIHEGWGQFGTMVTEGSMWKNISQLRQAFQKFQVPFEVIITVPRLGYTFSSQMSVELSASNTRSMQEYPTAPPISTTALIPDKQSTLLLKKPTGWYRQLKPLAISAIAVNLIAAVAYSFWLKHNAALTTFEAQTQYQQLDLKAPTRIFVQIPFTQQTPYVQDALARLEQEQPKTVSGSAPNFIYINKVKSRNVSSYFLCDHAITDKNNECTAYFSLQGETMK